MKGISQSVQNKELKEELIADNSFKEFKWHFRRWDSFAEHGISCKEFFEIRDGMTPEEWKALNQLRISEKRRKRNCKERILRMLTCGEPVYFFTLTFDNRTLALTSERTRRVYVQRFLRKWFGDYVGNVDYGDQNGREHYHAVVTKCKKCVIAFNPDLGFMELNCGAVTPWPYGFYNVEPCAPYSSGSLAEYVLKLTAHAVKRSTNPLGQRLIYARAL